MKLHTIRHISLVLALASIVYVVTTIPLLGKVTQDIEIYTPQQTERVPTIKRSFSPNYHWDSGIAQKSQQVQPSAQELMNELVKSTKLEVTFDTRPYITYYDAQILMAISQSEAQVDGVEGIAAVIKVVLNRVNSDQFPDTVEGVVTEKHQLSDGRWAYQFSPVDNTISTYFSTTPSLQAHLALAAVERGDYDWLDALYFENAEDSWQAVHCEYVCTIGHHKFYK